MTGDAPPHAPPWSRETRAMFRFTAIYFTLYLLPFPLGQIPLTSDIAATYRSAWVSGAQWVGPNVLGLPVIIQPTGSGDTALAFTMMLMQLVVALFGAVAWAAFDRRRLRYDRLYDVLRVYVRYGLAFIMLGYGAFKIIPTQFPYPPLVRLLEPLGNSSPMGLLWKFMGYSVPFSVFSGLGEFTGGFLLFFRRTSTLGALILIAVMGTVVMMNYSFDVPVKLYSSHLWLMACFLVLPDTRRLLNVLVLNRAAAPRALGALFPAGRRRLAAHVVKALLVGWAVWSTLSTSYGFAVQFAQRPPLYGIYEVRGFVSNGDTIPPLLTDDARWRRLIVDRGFGTGVATIQTMTGPLQGDDALRYRFEADTARARFTLTSLAESGEHFTFQYARTAPDVLEATGRWYTDSLRLRLERFDETTFPLTSRGYHWVSELPFNRE